MGYPIVFGILLVATGGSCVACGLYAIQNDMKTPINRAFLALSGAVLLWCLGLAITVVAENEAICSLGRRLAPFGWGAVFSILLHFILLLTQKNKLLKKWWIYPLLYLPAVVTVFAYTYLPLINLNQDRLVRTELGWINTAPTDVWDWFYYGCCLIFVIVTIIVICLWAKNSKVPNIKKQVKFLMGSLLAASIFGSFTDVMPIFLNIKIPQFSPVFVLFPIAAITYSVKRHGFMRPEAENENERILNESAYTNVYRYMGLIFGIGSIVNLVMHFLLYTKSSLTFVLLFSGALAVVAAFILIINRARLDASIKEMLFALILSFIIPVTTLRFVNYGSITVWTFIFLLIIICLLFNRRIILVTVIVSSILTQLIIWAAAPYIPAAVDHGDYIVRIGMIAFAAMLSFYVNKAYVQRLKENSNQISLQTLISKISHDFVSASEQNFNEKAYAMLKQCGSFIKSERAYMALYDPETKYIQYSCEWLAEGVLSQPEAFQGSSLCSILPEQFNLHNNLINVPDAAHIPPTENFRDWLTSRHIRALISLPIKKQDTTIGFLAFTAARPVKGWRAGSFAYLEVISNIVADATIKIGAEKEIKHIAYHDQLTHLPNRILFRDRLEQAIKRADQTEKMVGVVFLDLDSFKSVNDMMGHELGDKLLYEVAQIISQNIRIYDTVSRFGGDEFVILLNDIACASDLAKIMEKLIRTLHKPILLDGQKFIISASAGVALYPQDGTDAQTLIKNADTAMYGAKVSGKNQYMICSQDMKDQELEKMRLINFLYPAQEKNQFTLYYQPQVNMETHQIVGVEALLRWTLPGRGTVSPTVFIPLAEQTGLIHPIGEWVLQTACRQNKLWQDSGLPKLRMAVNISVCQLNNPNFANQVASILDRTGLLPGYLELEITESATSHNIDNILSIFNQLKALGISLAIDDFGTEYSSLSRLKVLPIDRIKMDMQFVQGIGWDEKDQAITKVIINLAKSLNLKVIAEGVETKLQLDFLGRKMCDEVQGYYYYKPMPAEELEMILGKQCV